MENISSRHSNEDTTTSMYLSFDADSTISTACYKTMEAMTDTSALSGIDLNDSVKTTVDHANSTLDNFQNKSSLTTVRKMEIPDVKLNTPLKALPKNIFREYNVLCSTPSKEQLLRTVDITRGSDATRCADIGLAFLGVEDEKPAYFPPPPVGLLHDENKENAFPDTEEVSTLSTCSSVEITTSVIEKKMLTSMTNAGSTMGKETVEEAKIIRNLEKEKSDAENDEVSECANNLFQSENDVNINSGSENLGTTLHNDVGVVKHSLKPEEEEKGPLVNKLENERNVKKFLKPMTLNARRSICEPNLLTNKPSRILNTDNKRRSLLPTCKTSTLNMDTETEIPLLINKMLKITNTPIESKVDGIKKEKDIASKQDKLLPALTRRSMSYKKILTSLIPSASEKKRPFSFNQRMPVVKTTLNSPARKIARKSSMSGTMNSIQRRSVIPQKITSADHLKPSEILPHKSLVPRTSIQITTQSNSKTLEPIQETYSKPTERKSLYPSAKISEISKICTGGLSHNIPDISYTCNICKEKFRIKSLLDAHKRSHESDKQPPAFIKKPSTITQPTISTLHGNSNQCKYCDKKFALLKALHIHLLQNCSKIPPSEKRKLQYTDLNHVGKAQLPNVFQHPNLQKNASSTVSSAIYTRTVKGSSESLNENTDMQKLTSDVVTTTAQKVKKITAHAGVYRTPSKLVNCHLCKSTFKSILDYTNHVLSTHGSHKASATDDTGKPVGKNISTKNA